MPGAFYNRREAAGAFLSGVSAPGAFYKEYSAGNRRGEASERERNFSQ